MTLPVTALTAAICAIMILLTAIATVRQRLKARVAFGEGDRNHALVASIRSHGNLTEHAPIVIIMIGLLEMTDVHHWTLTGVAVLFLAARALHIIGLQADHSLGKEPWARSLGVIGTWVTMAVLIGWILLLVVTVNG